MLYLIFAHTAEAAPLRIGPMPSFRLEGASIVDAAGTVLARHNGHRWTVGDRSFYRIDCAGPLVVQLDGAHAGAALRGPFEHFSLFNGTAYASRDVFAQYDEHEGAWHVYRTEERCRALLISAENP
jgi:hypothetical protein